MMQNIDIFLDNMKRFTQEHQSTWEERKIQKIEQQVVRLKEKLDYKKGQENETTHIRHMDTDHGLR